MNQSFDATNSYHLPKISQNESAYLQTKKESSADMRRSVSYSQAGKQKVNLTRKLVIMEDIKNGEDYENMNEKELLREH
jgi:hypothetical protein